MRYGLEGILNSRPVSGKTCRMIVTGECRLATLLTHLRHLSVNFCCDARYVSFNIVIGCGPHLFCPENTLSCGDYHVRPR
jgi:hypothetical protein